MAPVRSAPGPPPSEPAAVLPLGFRTSGLGSVPGAVEGPSIGPAAWEDPKPHDAAGVRLVRVHGTLQEHPTAQASYGQANLVAHSRTGDVRFLHRATAQAERLLVRAQLSDGALFFPFAYDFPLHGGKVEETMRAPWYSAMAQGMALGLFTRLHRATGEARWREAADATFASFLVPPSDSSPWVVHTHEGYLWLAEYPLPGGTSDLTFNGHNFAAFGVDSYARLSGSAEAKRILDGALTTTLAVAPRLARRGLPSSYGLLYPEIGTAKYHGVNAGQLDLLSQITGDLRFGANAWGLREHAEGRA
nr:D-glucuronyl C5-epimerase family protein [Motilibacter deserti]